MRKISTTLLLAISALTPAIPATAQSWSWATLGLNRRAAQATAIAVDPSTGNTWVGGVFRDTIQCGATTLVSVGGADMFVGQLNPTGQWLWAVRGGGAANDTLSALAAAPNGTAVLTGTVYGNLPATLNGFPVPAPSPLGNTMFVSQLGAGGTVQWLTIPNWGNPTGRPTPSFGAGIAADAAGHIYVCANLQSPDSLLPFSTTFLVGGIGVYDSLGCQGFVARLSATGAWEWATALPHATFGAYNYLTASADGATVCAGGSQTIQGWSGILGPFPIVVGVAGTTGEHLWQQGNGTVGSVCGLAADATGRVFAATAAMQSPGGEVHVMALTAATGTVQWEQTIRAGALIDLTVNGLATTPTGDVVLAGTQYSLPCLCDAGPSTPPPPPASAYEVVFSDLTLLAPEGSSFVARLSGATGLPQWSIGAPGRFQAVTIDAAGGTRVAGDFAESAPDNLFGTTALTLSAGARGPSALVAALNATGPLPRAFTIATGPAGVVLTLTGQNLTNATQVLVGGVSATFTVVNGALVIAVPPGASGTITVITPQGTATNLSYQPAAPLGTVGASQTARLQLWPNPATEAGSVRVTLPGEGPASVEILDLLGRSLLTLPAARGTVVLPLAGLPAGTYVVRAGAATSRLVVK